MKITLISVEKTTSATGIRTISSFLKQHGFETRMILAPSFPELYEERILEDIYALCKDSDLIGITCIFETTAKAEQVIKKIRPLGIPIVWGGPFATVSPEECIKHAGIVCIGEGEEAMLELARNISSGKGITRIKNLWVRRGAKIHKNPQRPLIKDLDSIPTPDYSLGNTFILEAGEFKRISERHFGYGEFNFNHPYFMSFHSSLLFHSSRGCPFSCSFCNNSALKNINKGYCKVRFMSPKKVIGDILSIRKTFKSIGFIWFTDDVFFARPLGDIKEFSRLYKKHIGLPFQCYANPRLVTEEKLKALVDAGLMRVRLGVQTGSDRLNNEVYRRFVSRRDALRSSGLIHKYLGKHDPPEYQFIIRNPYEKEGDIRETFKLIKEFQKPFDLQIFTLGYPPNSELYKRALSERIISKDGSYRKGFSFNKREDILYSIISCMEGRCNDRFYSTVPAGIVDRLAMHERLDTSELREMLSESLKRAKMKKTSQDKLIIDTSEFDKETVFAAAGEFTGRCHVFIEPLESNLIVDIKAKNKGERVKTEEDFMMALVRRKK